MVTLSRGVTVYFRVDFTHYSSVGLMMILFKNRDGVVMGHGSLLQWRVVILFFVAVYQGFWGHRALLDQPAVSRIVLGFFDNSCCERRWFKLGCTSLFWQQIVTGLLLDRLGSQIPTLTGRNATINYQRRSEKVLAASFIFLILEVVALRVFVVLKGLDVAAQVSVCRGGPAPISTEAHHGLAEFEDRNCAAVVAVIVLPTLRPLGEGWGNPTFGIFLV